MPLTIVLLIDRMKRFPMPICWTTHRRGEEEHRQMLRSSIMRTLPPTQGDWAAWWIWNLKHAWHVVAFLTICIWTGWETCYHSCTKPPTTDSARLYGQCLTIKQVPGIHYLKSINKSTSLKQKITCSNTCVMTVYNEHVGILILSRHNSSENENSLTGSTYTTTTHQQKPVTIQCTFRKHAYVREHTRVSFNVDLIFEFGSIYNSLECPPRASSSMSALAGGFSFVPPRSQSPSAW